MFHQLLLTHAKGDERLWKYSTVPAYRAKLDCTVHYHCKTPVTSPLFNYPTVLRTVVVVAGFKRQLAQARTAYLKVCCMYVGCRIQYKCCVLCMHIAPTLPLVDTNQLFRRKAVYAILPIFQLSLISILKRPLAKKMNEESRVLCLQHSTEDATRKQQKNLWQIGETSNIPRSSSFPLPVYGVCMIVISACTITECGISSFYSSSCLNFEY